MSTARHKRAFVTDDFRGPLLHHFIELHIKLGPLFLVIEDVLRKGEVTLLLDVFYYLGVHFGYHLLQCGMDHFLQPPSTLLGLKIEMRGEFRRNLATHTHTENGSVTTSRETTVKRMIVVE